MILQPAMSVLPALLLIAGASAQCLTGNDSPATMSAASKTTLIDSRFNFALESLRKAALMETQDNLFFSPHSIHQALTLAYFGARGDTEESLKKALRIPDDLSKVEVQRFYAYEMFLKHQLEESNETPNYEYNSANRLWITDTKKVRECMLDFFNGQLEKTDFHTNPIAAKDRINNWVSNVTKGHIRDLLPADAIDESTDLVLANAVYFKGFWYSRFDPANSKRDLFYSSGSQNSVVTFMRQKRSFNHIISEVLGSHVLELPYKGQEVSMYILLPPFATARSANDAVQTPADRDGVRQLIERIGTEKGSQELKELLDDGMPSREVEVSLPKFEVEKSLPIHTLLHAMGAGSVVTPNQADLRGFLEDGQGNLHLGDAVHRAKIEVSEEGTTAVAATAIFTFRSSRPLEPAIFNANHPFLYFIYEKPTRTILFSGVYRGPNPTANKA